MPFSSKPRSGVAIRANRERVHSLIYGKLLNSSHTE